MKYYNNIPGWFNFDNIYSEAIAKVPDDGVLVEVGTFLGKSLCYLLEASNDSKKNLSISCVDLFKITPDGGDGEMPWGENARIWEKNNGGTEALFLAFKKNVEDCPGKQLLKNIIRENSWDAANKFEDNSIDFLFIDASHLYENVKRDIENWYPKMKKNSTIAGHDYDTGVQQAVDEFFGKRGISVRRDRSSWVAYLNQ
jgi:hypothetical protein